MSVFDNWIGRFLLLYLAWPLVVMLAFVVWQSLKADTIRGLLTGLAAVAVFGAMVFVGWLFGSVVVAVVLFLVMDFVALSESLGRGVIVALMAVIMVVASIVGWRYLADEMGTDARLWKM